MRKLTLHRERALACFAVKYYCVIDQDQEAFLQSLIGQDQEQMMLSGEGVPLRNGETIQIELDENAHSFFAVVYLQSRNMTTEPAEIPAGDADVSFTIHTNFNGDKQLNFSLEAC